MIVYTLYIFYSVFSFLYFLKIAQNFFSKKNSKKNKKTFLPKNKIINLFLSCVIVYSFITFIFLFFIHLEQLNFNLIDHHGLYLYYFIPIFVFLKSLKFKKNILILTTLLIIILIFIL